MLLTVNEKLQAKNENKTVKSSIKIDKKPQSKSLALQKLETIGTKRSIISYYTDTPPTDLDLHALRSLSVYERGP